MLPRQYTALETRSQNVRDYAEKLVYDHENAAVEEGRHAAATGTYLPAPPRARTSRPR